MLCSYNFYDLSRIPDEHISHNEMSCVAQDAWNAAHRKSKKPVPCPWDLSDSVSGKYKRVIWRTIYRHTKVRREAFVAEINSLAGRKIAA